MQHKPTAKPRTQSPPKSRRVRRRQSPDCVSSSLSACFRVALLKDVCRRRRKHRYAHDKTYTVERNASAVQLRAAKRMPGEREGPREPHPPLWFRGFCVLAGASPPRFQPAVKTTSHRSSTHRQRCPKACAGSSAFLPDVPGQSRLQRHVVKLPGCSSYVYHNM